MIFVEENGEGPGVRFRKQRTTEMQDTMKQIESIVSVGSAVCAVAAALFWIQSTRVEDKATEAADIGPGFDGYMVVKNADGQPIHFISSYQKQALWSRRAAWAAAAAAILQAVAALI